MDLNQYQKFVADVTSKESNELSNLIVRLNELNLSVNVSLLLTAGMGLASESGEFDEIVKKITFQGKPFTEETRFHLKRELGDILWYWVNACRALDLDPYDVLKENHNKLTKRYTDGFSVTESENRAKGDL